jgi:hypothetical protein
VPVTIAPRSTNTGPGDTGLAIGKGRASSAVVEGAASFASALLDSVRLCFFREVLVSCTTFDVSTLVSTSATRDDLRGMALRTEDAARGCKVQNAETLYTNVADSSLVSPMIMQRVQSEHSLCEVANHRLSFGSLSCGFR